MLAVWAALFAVTAILLVEGSLYYYRTEAAPQWLKERKSLQTFISGVCGFGIMVGLVLIMQFLVDFGKQNFSVIDGVLLAAVLGVGYVGLKAIKRAESRLPSPAING